MSRKIKAGPNLQQLAARTSHNAIARSVRGIEARIPRLRASGAQEGGKAAQAPWKAQAQEGKPGAQGQGAHSP
jgi:hypothetical protein